MKKTVEEIGQDVGAQFGGVLRCESCQRIRQLTSSAAGCYLDSGWPKCCGYTMRWWTQRQIDACEVAS